MAYRRARQWVQGILRDAVQPLLFAVFFLVVVPMAFWRRLFNRGRLPRGGWRDLPSRPNGKASYESML